MDDPRWLLVLLGDADVCAHLPVAIGLELEAIELIEADDHPAVEVFERWTSSGRWERRHQVVRLQSVCSCSSATSGTPVSNQ